MTASKSRADSPTLAQILALGALVGIVLAPPEVDGGGRMILVATSTLALLVLAVDGKIPSGFLWTGLIGAVFLAGHSFWISIDFYRSLEFSGILWCYYCLFGVFYFTPHTSGTKRVGATLILLSIAVSIYGIYEFLWGSSAYSLTLSAETGEVLRTPILDGPTPDRIMSTFAMPGTLWGFLLVALPVHISFWNGARPLVRAGLLSSLGLLVAAGALTRSYGFAAGLGALILVWLLMEPTRRRRRLIAIGVGVSLIILIGGIYATRVGGHNPVSLRLQNWMTAVEIFAAYPFGSGLNTYAVAYPQHQQPGANETQYAHNTPLQLLAEGGVFVLVATIVCAVYLVRYRKRLAALTKSHRFFVCAFAVWIAHNLIDINVYFASVGAVGITLLAILASASKHQVPSPINVPRSRWVTGGIGAVSAAVIFSSGSIFVSGELLRRAQTELSYLQLAEAHETLELAATINPINSSILHEGGQVALELYQTLGEPRYLEQSRAYFERAVYLSPHKVGPHLGLALVQSTSSQREQALRQAEVAQTMNPYSRYVSSVRRLIEGGIGSPTPAAASEP